MAGRPYTRETFEGEPCKHGHTTRYKSCGKCVPCTRAVAERHRNNPDNTIQLRYLKARYGITVEQYLEMEKAQGGVCKICGLLPRGRWKRLEVDHDHVTGEVRGLLCNPCNMTLGLMEDQPARLDAAAAYLRNAKGRPIEGAAPD